MVREGYKKTDIGEIPNDWDVIPLSKVGEPKMCKRVLKEQTTTEGEIPFYKIGTFGDKPDAFISRELFDNYRVKYSYPKKGDILLSAAGTIGRTVIFDGKESYFQDSNIVWLDNNEKTVLNPYLYYCYNTVKWQTANGGTVSRLYNALLSKTRIAIPISTEEQCTIAVALSDIDSLIDNLEKLIEKKKAIKQGAMQELLTRKRRLPGFSTAWEDYTLCELLDYEQPQKYIVKSTDYSDSGTPVLTVGISFILGYTNEYFGVYNREPVIIFDDFTTGSRIVDFPFKVKSSAIKILHKKRAQDNLRTIYELMQIIDFPVLEHKRHWISQYSKINVSIPSPEEQTAIANVLTEMSNEIGLLEKKMAKLKCIKSGMMNKLLTGEIRLV